MPADLQTMANAIRVLSMDAVEKANCGHPGMPMGMADVAAVLWTRFLKFDASRPDWADRDRFVLSAGHGSMLLYSLLHLTGFKAMTMDQIRAFRQLNSLTPGHPEYGHTPGVETTTGPLGQGLATAVGMAIAERHLAARFGADLVDHRTWVVAGDGCLMEGVSQEAIGLAGRLKLAKLTVLWDDNRITIDGDVSLSDSTDQPARFKAAGWAVKTIDGHDAGQIRRALAWATKQDRPSLIACKTKIGKGSPNFEGTHDVHGKALGKDEVAATRAHLGWTAEPFVVPDEVLKPWRAAGRRGAKDRKAWEARLAGSALGAEFERAASGELPKNAFGQLDAFIAKAEADKPAAATRQHSGSVLEQVFGEIPDLVGGSADLTGSNNTFVKNTAILDAPDYAGRYINYGVREFGMTAAMNGMALHGGVIPYGGTFLVFSDYARPALRLAALMGVRTIFVGTHDSIGLGEDGPTHQPVEHLASLRAMPNLNVFRPADAVETAECWKVALGAKTTPSVMALSRQKTPAVRTQPIGENLSARGAYQLAGASLPARVTLFASGTEVAIALSAKELLESQGIGAGLGANLVDEGFHRKDIADLAGRAQRRRTQRRGGKPFDVGARIGKQIRRVGIERRQPRRHARTVDKAARHCRQQRRPGRGGIVLRHHRHRLPGQDLATCVQRRAQVQQLRRTFGVPAMLVLAHPLQPDRLAQLARDQRRLKRRVVIAVAAIAARAVFVDQPQLGHIQAQQLSNNLAHPVRALGGSPYRAAAVTNVSHSAGWPHGSMRLDRPAITCFQYTPALREDRRRVAGVAKSFGARHRRAAHGVEQFVRARQGCRFAPACAQRPHGADCVPFPRRRHRQVILDPHNADARNLGDGRGIHALQFGADGRRADDAGMHHTVDADILDIIMAAGEFGGQVRTRQRLADNGIVTGVLELCILVDSEIEPAILDQGAKTDRPAARNHRAIFGVEAFRRLFQLRGGEIDKPLPGRRRRLTNLDAANHDPRAAAGAALVGG